MNSNQVNLIFSRQLLQISENATCDLAFMVPVGSKTCKDFETQKTWSYICKVDFAGPASGELYIGITEDIMPELVENMLGVEPGEEMPEGVQQVDALKELLNIICGNLLPELAGDQAVFDIGGPVILEEKTICNEIPGRQLNGAAEIDFGSGNVELRLFFDSEFDVTTLKTLM